LISGGSGSDQIFGDQGDDVISPGSGLNIVSGGAGADIFAISSLVSGSDLITLITDFEDGSDLLASYLPIVTTKAFANASGDGVEIVFSDGRVFQLQNLETKDLSIDDFICFSENQSLGALNDSRSLQADCDLDGDGYSNLTEVADETDPLNRFSCRSGCFSFDVDQDEEAKALTDGLLVIRHLFGFSGDSLITGATSGSGQRTSPEEVTGFLNDASSELDIDGDGEDKALTDGLLLIRYLFGFTGESLTTGAVGSGASRTTSDEIKAYISERIPVQE